MALTRFLNVRVRDDLVKAIIEEAKKLDTTKSEIVNHALANYFLRKDKGKIERILKRVRRLKMFTEQIDSLVAKPTPSRRQGRKFEDITK